ncbi:MAG: transketolase C-terminal domain-containing protein [Candidatus Gracilibacteria bacterium]|jgi:transketolase
MSKMIPKKESLLKAFEEELIVLAKYHKNLVVINSDFTSRLGLNLFSNVFPERQFNFGLAEQNAVGISAGLNIRGKVPMICGFSNFSLAKSYEIIRDAICYPNLNIKFIAFGNGFSEAREGVSYQSFEDIALMRTLPNMRVFCAADAIEARSILRTMTGDYGPAYLRLTSELCSKVHAENYDFKPAQLDIVREGKDVALFAVGPMVYRAKIVAEKLKEDGIDVLVANVSSIKLADEIKIKEIFSTVKMSFSVEDHNVIGGIGSMLADVLAENPKSKLKMIGIRDAFGKSAKSGDLYKNFGLDTESLYETIKGFLKMDGLL